MCKVWYQHGVLLLHKPSHTNVIQELDTVLGQSTLAAFTSLFVLVEHELFSLTLDESSELSIGVVVGNIDMPMKLVEGQQLLVQLLPFFVKHIPDKASIFQHLDAFVSEGIFLASLLFEHAITGMNDPSGKSWVSFVVLRD